MKIRYLGTGAAEAIPAFFCKCRVCENARLVKGKEIRTRSQALINDDLLIEFGPDTNAHLIAYDFFKLEDIKNILVTHSHPDHLDVEDIVYIKEGYANVVDGTVNMYLSTNGYNMVNEAFDKNGRTNRIALHEILPFNTYEIGNYKVTPLKANHSEYTSPVLYLIDDGNKTILYAHDTGYFPEDTIEYLSKINKSLDLISLDCTAGLLKNWHDHHLSYDMFKNVIQGLKDIKAIDNKTIIVANHFSHNGIATYEEMKNEASKNNVLVSYDGMEINL